MKKHLSVTVEENIYDIIMSYKEDKGITTSKATEELIESGSNALKDKVDSIKGNVLSIIRTAKHLEELIKKKS